MCICIVISVYLVLFSTNHTQAINSEPIQGYFSTLMPVYPNSNIFPIGESIQFNNENLKIAYFLTYDSPLKVTEYFQSIWESQGLITFDNITGNVYKISIFDNVNSTILSVIIEEPKKSLKTVVFLSEVPFSENLLKHEQKDNKNSDMPVYPDSWGLNSIKSRGYSGLSSITSYTNSAGRDNNINFLIKELSKRNWKYVDQSTTEDHVEGTILVFKRNRAKLSASISGKSQKGFVSGVVITRIE